MRTAGTSLITAPVQPGITVPAGRLRSQAPKRRHAGCPMLPDRVPFMALCERAETQARRILAHSWPCADKRGDTIPPLGMLGPNPRLSLDMAQSTDQQTISRASVGLRSERGPILLSVMLSVGLIAIDATILATAVPSIVNDLGGFAQFPWLFSVYLLAQAVSVPIF